MAESAHNEPMAVRKETDVAEGQNMVTLDVRKKRESLPLLLVFSSSQAEIFVSDFTDKIDAISHELSLLPSSSYPVSQVPSAMFSSFTPVSHEEVAFLLAKAMPSASLRDPIPSCLPHIVLFHPHSLTSLQLFPVYWLLPYFPETCHASPAPTRPSTSLLSRPFWS